jgi:hypothetical protein
LVAVEWPRFVGRANVACGSVAVRIDRYGGQPGLTSRAHQTDGNLAPVGDQKLAHGS